MMKNLNLTDSITGTQKKFLDTLFYQSIKNNPLADRLRRCPGCGLYHFITHRSRDYHDDDCADAHYNLKRLENSHALKAGAVISTLETGGIINEVKTISAEPTKDVALSTEIAAEKKPDITAVQSKNQKIFVQLLGNATEAAVTPEQIFPLGFQEEYYDVLVRFPDSDLAFAVYNEYCLSWDDTDLLVITLLKNMLWAHM